MQERPDFEHERNLDEHLTTDEKVSKLWREREIRLYIRAKRVELLKIWGGALTAAATAATLLTMAVSFWKK